MRVRGKTVVAFVAASVLLTNLAVSARATAPHVRRVKAHPLTLSGKGRRVHHGRNGQSDVNVCTSDAIVQCLARVRTDSNLAGIGDGAGYTPAFLQSAYNLPSNTLGAGRTVAVVDEGDDPNAEADLAVYRATYGLPPCTTANRCFRKVDGYGGTNYPAANPSWSVETSLDLDMVSAICPRCRVILLEAHDLNGLYAAQNTAVALGANAISDSWVSGVGYSTNDIVASKYFNHPGVAITAATGDNGYRGDVIPASLPGVIAVGGTSLYQSTKNGVRSATETAWSGSGSGCSNFRDKLGGEAKPSWQRDTICRTRSTADVSAVADPSTGVSVYDSYQAPGFLIVGGTSASSPIVASIYALAGPQLTYPVSYTYEHATALNDITSGSNGSCGTPICNAGPGYDGPTGLGTPNGIAAFNPSATCSVSTATYPNNPGMTRGQCLMPGGGVLQSHSKFFTLAMRPDGNLVEYVAYPAGGIAWCTHTDGGVEAVLQRDGNFVVYAPSGAPLWSSGPQVGALDVALDDQGILQIEGAGHTLWSNASQIGNC